MTDFLRLFIVEVSDEPIKPGRPWTDPKNGLQKMLPGEQKGYLHQGAAYPLPFTLEVPFEGGPYKPGFYFLAGECFTAGKYGKLEFSQRQLDLVPVRDAVDWLHGQEKFALTPAQPKVKAA